LPPPPAVGAGVAGVVVGPAGMVVGDVAPGPAGVFDELPHPASAIERVAAAIATVAIFVNRRWTIVDLLLPARHESLRANEGESSAVH
jgi:hypothetical protein